MRNIREIVSLGMVPIQELLSAEISAFIYKNRKNRIADLMLRMPLFEIDGKWIAAQIEGWQKATSKLPQWAANSGIIYPIRLSMEQCSSEKTAQYKASLMKGSFAIDLTGGFGVDTLFLGKSFTKVLYIEQQEELAEIAHHNFKAFGQYNIEVQAGNSIEIISTIQDKIDLLYLDPARRKDLQKVFRLSDCEPNAIDLLDEYFALSNTVLIKTSPMLDISEAIRQLKRIKEIHIISIDNECKEVLYLLEKEYLGEPAYICFHNNKNKVEHFTFVPIDEVAYKALLSDPLDYIYEPNPSILKAGAFNSITKKYAVSKLNVSTHLYTSKELIPDFPGRRFALKQIAAYNKKELNELIPMGKANIQTRNFPDSVEAIRKKTGLKDGGDVFIFATTLTNERKVILICSKA